MCRIIWKVIQDRVCFSTSQNDWEDSDWAGCPAYRGSTSSYCIFYFFWILSYFMDKGAKNHIFTLSRSQIRRNDRYLLWIILASKICEYCGNKAALHIATNCELSFYLWQNTSKLGAVDIHSPSWGEMLKTIRKITRLAGSYYVMEDQLEKINDCHVLIKNDNAFLDVIVIIMPAISGVRNNINYLFTSQPAVFFYPLIEYNLFIFSWLIFHNQLNR